MSKDYKEFTPKVIEAIISWHKDRAKEYLDASKFVLESKTHDEDILNCSLGLIKKYKMHENIAHEFSTGDWEGPAI